MFCFFGNAQEGMLTLTSKKNIPLFLIVNDALQNEVPKDTIHILLPNGSNNIKIVLIDSLKFCEKNIFIQNDNNQHYQFSIENSIADLNIIGECLFKVKEANQIIYKKTNQNSFEFLKNYFSNSTFVSSIFNQVSYNGKKGCVYPSYINKYQLIEEISTALLTTQKVKIIIKNLTDKCIKIEDLYDILIKIDYEDTRLDLIHRLKPYIFDLDNLNELEKLFSICQYKEAFQSTIFHE